MKFFLVSISMFPCFFYLAEDDIRDKLVTGVQTCALPISERAVRGSATGRPLMAALDLLGRRWALRILWELTDGPRGARELRQRCDAMSPSVLYQRLARSEERRVVREGGERRRS